MGKHPQRHAESAFKMPAGRVMSWVGILFFITILIMLGFSADSRQALSPLLSG
ncbi:D-serine/D-alanine/glycine transporter [Cutibacterium acnes JCM 18909]|nr:D-serine/D-alanine/glycine transporter [Cutibacterium acnes JCM 18909]